MACAVGSSVAGLGHRPACLVTVDAPRQFRRRVSPPDDGPAGYAPRVATPGRDAVSADVFEWSAVCSLFTIPRMLMLCMLLVHCKYGNINFIILSVCLSPLSCIVSTLV